MICYLSKMVIKLGPLLKLLGGRQSQLEGCKVSTANLCHPVGTAFLRIKPIQREAEMREREDILGNNF